MIYYLPSRQGTIVISVRKCELKTQSCLHASLVSLGARISQSLAIKLVVSARSRAIRFTHQMIDKPKQRVILIFLEQVFNQKNEGDFKVLVGMSGRTRRTMEMRPSGRLGPRRATALKNCPTCTLQVNPRLARDACLQCLPV